MNFLIQTFKFKLIKRVTVNTAYLGILFTLLSCEDSRLEIDLSDIELDINIERFDKDILRE